MKKIIYICTLLVVLISCDDYLVSSQTVSLENAKWNIKQAPVFKVSPPDTTNTYDLFINLRNNHEYAFSNLYLISEIKFPQGRTFVDTLEFDMTDNYGRYLGRERGDLYENKLWLREGIRFRESGTYHLTLRHVMRKTGEITPVQNLNGIVDLGYSIEKPKNYGKD
ncbi:gliding motility lipoprotein GldH [Nonlabens tegetincola]|uniref:gliding motility lipoprotein GldH n=1 Tax=Nonlabens tegetincola TaxID=323273 RepID=UPI0005A723D7|nr:gliding motility lipoprotein GldH [Nonlabens tegetincola]